LESYIGKGKRWKSSSFGWLEWRELDGAVTRIARRDGSLLVTLIKHGATESVQAVRYTRWKAPAQPWHMAHGRLKVHGRERHKTRRATTSMLSRKGRMLL
jgi:hypothetical protein